MIKRLAVRFFSSLKLLRRATLLLTHLASHLVTLTIKEKIYNFKSKEHWSELFELSGFRLNSVHNRFLDGDYVKDDKNVTQLYWAVYEHALPSF